SGATTPGEPGRGRRSERAGLRLSGVRRLLRGLLLQPRLRQPRGTRARTLAPAGPAGRGDARGRLPRHAGGRRRPQGLRGPVGRRRLPVLLLRLCGAADQVRRLPRRWAGLPGGENWGWRGREGEAVSTRWALLEAVQREPDNPLPCFALADLFEEQGW